MKVSPGSLIADSWHFCISYIGPLLFGCIVWGVLSGIVGGYSSEKFIELLGPTLSSFESIETIGTDLGALEELQEGLEAGDPEALAKAEEFAAAFENDIRDGFLDALPHFGRFLGFVFLVILIQIVITGFACTYFLLVSIHGKRGIGDNFIRSFGVFFPLLIQDMWVCLRSFLWVPLFNIVALFWLVPRYIPAPYILVAEKKGILTSTKESFDRTKGHWDSLIVNMFILIVITWILSSIMQLALMPFTEQFFQANTTVIYGTSIVSGIVSQMIYAYAMVFCVMLSRRVLEAQMPPKNADAQ